MKEYDVKFCSCGTIHLMPMEYYDWLQEDYTSRYVLRICQRCGSVIKVWLDEGFESNSFNINSTSINEDSEITPEDLQNCRVLLSRGHRVPLVNGNHATYHVDQSWFDGFYRRDVDTKRLIREVKDPEKLRSIAGYASGIDWSGTDYSLDKLLNKEDK